MSLKLPTAPNAGLFKQGYNSYSAEDGIVNRNIAAVREIAEMVRTSVGPAGRNKVIVNHLEKIFVTSDASTILREIDIVHPAVKVLVMASQQQDAELGDASNLVVVLCGELLALAEELLRIGMSTAEIVQGYELALGHALDSLAGLASAETSLENPAKLEETLAAVIAPKQYGDEDTLAALVSQAVAHTIVRAPAGAGATATASFSVDSVRIVKILGAGLTSSHIVKGMVFPNPPEGTVRQASGKVAVFTGPVDIAQTETKGTVLLQSAKEMLEFSKGEEQRMESRVQALSDAGVRIVIAGGGVGALALHYLNRFGILCFRIGSKFDLQRLCRVTGATPLPVFDTPSPGDLGSVDEVRTQEIGGDRVTIFEQEGSSTRTATIVLRGATQNYLDGVERAIEDALNAVKAITKDTRVVPGAGASEIAIATAVFSEGEKTSSVLQHAIKRYARAFEVVPRTLAENAGLDGTDVVSRLYAAASSSGASASVGVNVDGSAALTVDTGEARIHDIYIAKKNAIELATQATITILSVNQIIMAKRSGGPSVPKRGGDWDQD